MTGKICIGLFLAFMIGLFLYGTIEQIRFTDRCQKTQHGHVVDTGRTHELCIAPDGRIIGSR